MPTICLPSGAMDPNTRSTVCTRVCVLCVYPVPTVSGRVWNIESSHSNVMLSLGYCFLFHHRMAMQLPAFRMRVPPTAGRLPNLCVVPLLFCPSLMMSLLPHSLVLGFALPVPPLGASL